MGITQAQEDGETQKLLAEFVARMDLVDDTVPVEDVFNGIGNDGFIQMGYIGPKPVNRFINFKMVLDRWQRDGRIRILSKEGPFPKWTFGFDRGLCGLPRRGSPRGGPLPQIDALTGLYVRGNFDNDLEALVGVANSALSPLALAMIDIDSFKKVNDQHGHPAGDSVLKEMAQEVKDAIANKANAYRYGGEEMAVVLPNFTREEAITTSERIRQAIEKKRVDIGSNKICVTVSIGVGFYVLGESVNQLVKRADAALYQAKTAGKNRVSAGNDYDSDA
ncbi:MAG: GGDEF domain-containing protein [Chloroflexi bacterium]|nr:GGDEF domain-containing protein [Chloroflexota bacterium]